MLTVKSFGSRKRRRTELEIEPDKRGHIEKTEKTEKIEKYIECLHLRISILEDLFNETTPYQPPQRTHETLGVGERITSLEGKKHIDYDFHATLRDSFGRFCCPVKDCARNYKTTADLHVHVRKKPGNGHDILRKIVDRTYCIRCNIHFKRPRDLQHHERVNHGEKYDSRIEPFLEHFTEGIHREYSADHTKEETGSRPTSSHSIGVCYKGTGPKAPSISTGSIDTQSFANRDRTKVTGSCIADNLLVKAQGHKDSCFTPINAFAPVPYRSFEAAPAAGSNTNDPVCSSLSDPSFPFNMTPYPPYNDIHSSSPFELEENSQSFAGVTIVNHLDSYKEIFPFDITPPNKI